MELVLEGGPVEIVGALDVDRSEAGIAPRRLPAWTRPQIPDLFMDFMVTLTSGVRVTFRTDSPWIELDAMPTGFVITGIPAQPVAFDLVVDEERVARAQGDYGTRLVIDLVTLDLQVQPGDPAELRFEDLGSEMKSIELWLPQNAATELRSLRVADGSAVEPVLHTRRRWAHYGSSISHCIEAHGPTEIWPAVAARLGDVELLQFGFAGQCHLDQFVARSIAEQQPDLISLKVGINVVNADSLKERTFAPALHGFLDTLREAQPETPILVVSPIICPLAEDHPGPTVPDGHGGFRVVPDGPPELRATSLTLQRIRSIVDAVVAGRRDRGDANLFTFSGLELFGEGDAPTLPDGLHPDGDGYLRIGERFAALAFGPGRPFG
ncbi:MAG: lipase [Acidimicrobiia bacterium]|nr:lipase [Acidimicrobiia bacterium]